MLISTRKGSLTEEICDVLVLCAYAGEKDEVHLACDLPLPIKTFVLSTLKEDAFKASEGASMLIRTHGEIPSKRILVVGLGKKEACDANVLRRVCAQTYQTLKPYKLKTIAMAYVGKEGIEASCMQAMVEGIRLSTYVFGRYKKQEEKQTVKAWIIVLDNPRFVRKAKKSLALGELAAEGTMKARDLVNTPAVHLSPKDLVDAAREITKGKEDIRLNVFDQEQLTKMKAGGLLAVNQGSDHDAFMAHMIYKPKKKTKKKIVLVGKAVTFDSGGLSLKPSDGMMDMKIDMSGAAVVLGLFSIISKLKPSVEVHGVFGAVENMPSGKAIRPGDIVTALNGKTIEILNTDAEGRVTLADTLTYACKQKPDMIIDLATLTGACMVALGEEITGLMSNNVELAQRVLASAREAGEQMWELPLYKGYRQLILSELADVKNIGGRYGGALTAGLFLQEFIEKDIPWVHLDIAGPASAERPHNPYEQKGATGHPVRTLIQFLQTF